MTISDSETDGPMDLEELVFKLSIRDLADQDSKAGRPAFTAEYLNLSARLGQELRET